MPDTASLKGSQYAADAIAVVIPHLNQPDFLARCLDSLARMTRQPDEIVVVDNGSLPLPDAVCAKYPNVRLVQELTPGPGPARNLGASLTTAPILAFIDADCLADESWLTQAAAAMDDPAASILGGDVRIALADPARVTMLEAYESIYAYRMDRYIAREGFTGTGNLVVRRTVLNRVGPFGGLDVAEDRDWGQRATKMGEVIRYVPGMKVYHPARQQFSQLVQKWDRHMSHDITRARTRPLWQLRWGAKTLVMGASPLAELPRIIASDRVTGLRSRALAFAGLVRIRAYRARRMTGLLVGTTDAQTLAGRWNRG